MCSYRQCDLCFVKEIDLVGRFIKGFSYLHNVATLELYPEKCIGCGWCLEVCPHQVFPLVKNKTHHRFQCLHGMWHLCQNLPARY
ncbi:4Fe-4S binding protein [Pelotomaculum terephthalicicum]|uniref:4Fe-4S binding protein n=1 Tax=Pelotomaculum terephthalicicum TaxID=206393 RepID=UPI0025803B57|nr:4Fe-4S binding protein [Pelotomaculum sp. PtaB.Bin117]